MTLGRPTAICTYLAPITTEGLEADVVELVHKVERARACYREKIAERGGKDEKDMACMWAVCGEVEILERHLECARELVRLLRPAPAKIRVMVVGAGDLGKDLQERGYRYEQDGYWSDPFGVHARPAWCKRVLVDDVSLGRLAVELAGLGIEIQMDGQLGEAVASLKYKMSQVVEL